MGLFSKKQKTDINCGCENVGILKSGNTMEEREEEIESCGCGEGCCNQMQRPEQVLESEIIIKVLGSGCKNCVTLAENVKKALLEINLEAKIEKVTDFAEITNYGVMSTPALVVNEKVVSYGKVLKSQEVANILAKTLK